MLTKEKNDFYCQVGPGTPMGEAMRRFWWPVALSKELPEPDSAPILLRLLGERFVAFRDTKGRVGVLDELCCHRGASLLLGRVEACGIECIYHGWKYDVEGKIISAPMVAGRSETLRQPSYPAREAGGLIWTYIGPREHEPPFRKFVWMDLKDTQRSMSAAMLPFNYLAIVENQVDSPHVGVLHKDSLPDVEQYEEGRESDAVVGAQEPPVTDIQETDYGFSFATLRNNNVKNGAKWASGDSFILPTTVFIPPGFCSMAVPADDVTTITYLLSYSVKGDVVQRPPSWEMLPWLFEQAPGRLLAKPKLTLENGFLQDRASMRNGSYSGLPGRLAQEDLAIWVSMGPYPTRAMEHLVAYDRAVVKLRAALSELAHQVAAGETPPAAMTDVSHVREIDGPLDAKGDWRHLMSAPEPA